MRSATPIFFSLLAASCGHATPPAPAPPSSSQACAEAGFRQMDFWLGDWDLVIRAKEKTDSEEWTTAHGTNHVTAPLGKCVIEEAFRGDGPGQPWAGMSVSTFVPKIGAWRQTWVDDAGSYLAFQGGPVEGAFVLLGEPRDESGKRIQMRMVFKEVTPDAFVWSWERGTVGGADWNPRMEIRYTRKGR